MQATELTNLTIDDRPVQVEPGTKVLRAALHAGVYIPHMCSIREAEPALASCRLCMVEVEGRSELVASCSEPVAEGMVVHTNTPRAARLRRTAFELILSNHPVRCGECAKNGSCGLQVIAKRLHVPLKQKHFRNLPREYPVDNSHPLIRYDPNMCVLCGKCVWMCQHRGAGVLDFAFRGMKTVVSPFGGMPLKDTDCNGCGECAAICGVGAFSAKGPCPAKPRMHKEKVYPGEQGREQ